MVTQRSCIDNTVNGVTFDDYCYKMFIKGAATTCLFCDKNDCNGNELKAPEEVGQDDYGNRISETDLRSKDEDDVKVRDVATVAAVAKRSLIFLSVSVSGIVSKVF